MNSRPGCQARIIGDQYRCDKCGLVWDISDLDPPDCRKVFNVGTPGHVDHGEPSRDKEFGHDQVEKIRNLLSKEPEK